MLLLTNDRTLVQRLGLVPLLARLDCKARFAEERDVATFFSRVARAELQPGVIMFSIDPARYLDTVDWVSSHGEVLDANHIPVVAVCPRGEREEELLVCTNRPPLRVEHLSRQNLERTVEILLTIHFEFLLDEFAEHDYPGLNDMVEKPDRKFNVQTQFYPGSQPRISTEIYVNGRILKTFTHHVKESEVERHRLRFLIEEMHSKVLGSLDHLEAAL
jgi:hypothetical protein